MLNFSQTTIYSLLCIMIPCGVYFILKRRRERKTYWLQILVFLLYLWQVYSLTGIGGLSDLLSRPQGGDSQSLIQANINLAPFFMVGKGFYLNILMCIPLGFLLPLIWTSYRKWYRTVLFGACFSLMIELSQLITTRVTDIDDFIANTFGAFLGYLIWKVISLCFRGLGKKGAEGAGDAVCYLLFSFLGSFFLYHPLWFSNLVSSFTASYSPS